MNDPHAMRINADLAKEIGLNESIVLLQLEYLIGVSANERDGMLWTYQSLTDLKDVYFKWWSVATISRIIKSLERMQLIHVRSDLNRLGYDRTQWYALNYEGIYKLHSVAIFQSAKSDLQSEKPILQSDRMDHVNLQNGTDQVETTIPKTTHETTQKKEEGAAVPIDNSLRAAAAAICGLTGLMSEKQKLKLDTLVAQLHQQGITVEQLQLFEIRWYDPAWNYLARNAKDRGRRLTRPTPDQIISMWADLMVTNKPAPQQQYQQPKPAEAGEFLDREALAAKMEALRNGR